MFYIRKNSIHYISTSRGLMYTADLLEKGTDNRVGTVENLGCGGGTKLTTNHERTKLLLTSLSKITEETEAEILEAYIDIAEGHRHPLNPELIAKLTSY